MVNHVVFMDIGRCLPRNSATELSTTTATILVTGSETKSVFAEDKNRQHRTRPWREDRNTPGDASGEEREWEEREEREERLRRVVDEEGWQVAAERSVA